MIKKVKIFLTSYLVILTSFFYSQTNLVPNPSFEDTINCPNGDINKVKFWFDSGGDAEGFNPCSNSYTSFGVPNNIGGHRTPYDGNSYAGLGLYFTHLPNVRENICVQLAQPLVKGTNYYVSAYISRSDNLDGQGDSTGIAINKFGFLFSTLSHTANPAPINNFAQVYSSAIITDTLNWTKIEGSFVADSVYNYLTVGNFYDDSHTNKIMYSNRNCAYYYVDMICVSTNSLTCNYTFSGIKTLLKNESIKIYPNPVNDILYLDGITENGMIFKLFTTTGVAVMEGKLEKGKNQIIVSPLARGAYIIELNQKLFYKLLLIPE
jgi:hypothetical protein